MPRIIAQVANCRIAEPRTPDQQVRTHVEVHEGPPVTRNYEITFPGERIQWPFGTVIEVVCDSPSGYSFNGRTGVSFPVIKYKVKFMPSTNGDDAGLEEVLNAP